MILMITGKEGTGKTTLGFEIAKNLRASGHACAFVDGELVRNITGNDRFTNPGRQANAWATGKVASAFSTAGFNVIVAAVFPTQAVRFVFQSACRQHVEWVHLDYEPYVAREHSLVPFESIDTVCNNVNRITQPAKLRDLAEMLRIRYIRNWLSVITTK
jgi:adenylylsulfate kinase-like enzyme